MKQPIFVTFVFFGVLITGSAHLIGVIETFRQWRTLQALLGRIAYYVLFSNLVLGLAAVGVLIAIWFRYRKAKWSVLGYFLLFIFLNWLDRLVFFQTKDFIRLPFVIGFQILMGMTVYLGLERKSVKAYFGESNA
ncbi:MAG: hypothetical protein ACK44E_09345 [Anaerolineales bacterium]